MKTIYFCATALILFSACSSSPEFTPPSSSEPSATAPTELRVYSRARQLVPSECVLQNGNEISQFSAPATLKLPVAENAAGSDILVTCELDGEKRSAILSSRVATSQRNVLVDAASGDALVVSEINDESATSGFSNVSDLLALGLSTNVIAGNFYTYPSLVSIRF